MSVHILTDSTGETAAMYCSTSDWAFGPVFNCKDGHDADDRAELFLRWLKAVPTWDCYEQVAPRLFRGERDPRVLTESGLERAYADWLAQEEAQWKAEEDAETAQLLAED